MSFFPRSFISEPATSYTPLFRLLEDYENFNSGNAKHHHRTATMKTFSPKFDVKEVHEAYELHGELPGIEQKDIQIEFTDAQTLTVRGRTERSFTSGTPPAGLVEPSKTAGAIESGEARDSAHRATVADEDAAENPSNEVAKAEPKEAESKAKYWVSERSVGEFSRSFTFPVRVDQDAVYASMKNGILSVIVPKAKKLESRKITIN